MDVGDLEKSLCQGVEPSTDSDSDFRKIEKVLAPFLRTLKKRKRVKADVLPDEYKELYLKHDPKDLLIRLQEAFADPVSVKTLMHETAELLKNVIHADSFNLYLADYSRGELLLCPKYVQNNDRFEARYLIEFGTYLAPYVAFTKKYVLSDDVMGDVRFPLGIPYTGTTVKSVMCVPILTNVEGNCIGVVELYRMYLDDPFNLTDLQVCSALFAWLGIAVEQNKARLLLLKQVEVQAQLSALANLYFSSAIPFSKAVSDIIEITKVAVNAQQGAFYVFHEPVPLHAEHVLSADAYVEGTDAEGKVYYYKKSDKIKFEINQPGLPGYVARSGESVNVQDAYKDSRFNRKNDTKFFKTKSLVMFPVKNAQGVLAVLKLVNSMSYPYFRKDDENLVNSHLNYVSLICGFYLLETASNKMKLKLVEMNKLLDFFTKPPQEDLNVAKAITQGEPKLPIEFYDFVFDTTNLEDESYKYILFVFMSLDFLDFRFEPHNLADFVLRVKKAYRPVYYHNFDHAFVVFHFAYNIIKKNHETFSSNDVVSILIAALCHDVDHEGLTNSFMGLKNDSTYKLYGDFCGEAHRYEITMFLIQATDLLLNVSAENFKIISKSLKRLMLAFDLAIHFQNRQKITELLNTESFSWEDPHHRHLLNNMILICSDHAPHFKSFDLVKKFTSSYYKELYKQGDLEKSMGFYSLPILDRNKIDAIPQNQIIMLSVVCLPCVEVICELLPNLMGLVELIGRTIKKWKEMISLRGVEMWKLNQALVRDKKDKRPHKVVLSSTLSSIRTLASVSKSDRN